MHIRNVVHTGVMLAFLSIPAFSGSILLTGHDVTLHGGQDGFDTVALDYLRGAGSASAIARADYSIAVIGSGAGSWNFTEGGQTKPGFESTTYYDTDLLEAGTQSFADALSKDVLIILSHTSCGGCDLSTAGSNYINSQSAAIAARFNAGMDIFAEAGATLSTYYQFLPPGAVASGLPISGAFGFTPTALGTAIGLTSDMVNGHQTHNQFTGYVSAFQVFETRGAEIVTIGIRDARIEDGEIGGTVPEPSTYLMMAAGLVGLVARRRYSA